MTGQLNVTGYKFRPLAKLGSKSLAIYQLVQSLRVELYHIKQVVFMCLY
nr:MAG TPA: hypothetical protein [Caudoviricetes sp.]